MLLFWTGEANCVSFYLSIWNYLFQVLSLCSNLLPPVDQSHSFIPKRTLVAWPISGCYYLPLPLYSGLCGFIGLSSIFYIFLTYGHFVFIKIINVTEKCKVLYHPHCFFVLFCFYNYWKVGNGCKKKEKLSKYFSVVVLQAHHVARNRSSSFQCHKHIVIKTFWVKSILN